MPAPIVHAASITRLLSIKGFTTPGASALAIARLQEEEIAQFRLLYRYVPPWSATSLSHAHSSSLNVRFPPIFWSEVLAQAEINI